MTTLSRIATVATVVTLMACRGGDEGASSAGATLPVGEAQGGVTPPAPIPAPPPPAQPAAVGFRHENTPENLRALMLQLRQLQSTSPEAGAALTVSLLPDATSLAAALRPGTDPATSARILAGFQGITPPDTARRAGLLTGRPSQTEVAVHAATTEQIAANAPGTVVFAEFPGGAVSAAQTLLRPGMTWYEVELLEPGADRGMKFHLFYWDGAQWRMLGPVWRFTRA